jgi:hypothetical protein
VTNVYQITADAPLVMPANLTLAYSNLEPDPNDVYTADDPNGQWTSIGHAPQAALWTIDTRADRLGYFAAGYSSSGSPPGSVRIGLPIVVGLLIVVVVLVGLPLVVRNRASSRT